MTSTQKAYDAERRSTRVRAQLPIRVNSLEPGIEFSERCHTLVVNLEGCGVRLSRALEPGLRVSLDELPCGRTVPARVANSVPLGTDGKYWLVGIAMEEKDNIWCIQPAPADWGAAVAPVAAAVERPKKADEWPYAIFSPHGEAHPGRK